MRFLYEGFTHEGDTRSFTFKGINEHKVEALFSIHVNLPLFARNHVSMQDAPGFCLQLLTNACGSPPHSLLALQQYTVLQEDLLPILEDRERRAKLKSLKAAPRRVLRKPSTASQIIPAGRPAL
jgi:hypothetical protein